MNIGQTCNRSSLGEAVPYQAVHSKMCIELFPKELQDLIRLNKVFISKRNLFKKVAIVHGNGEFKKVTGNFFDILAEDENVCNILPRPVGNSKCIVVKGKRDLKYQDHASFEPVHPAGIHTALRYLKKLQ